MLADEHRRRRRDRDLASGKCRQRGGAKRDFGLAVADIADDQPVNRRRAREVGADRGDGARLIGSFEPREAGGKAFVSAGVGVDRRRRPPCALGREVGQPARGLGNRGIDIVTTRRPRRAIELVEGDRVGLAAVAPDQVGVGDRDLTACATGEFENDRIAAVVDRERFEAGDDGEAKAFVDDDVTNSHSWRGGQRDRRRRGGRIELGAATKNVGGGEEEPAVLLPAGVDDHRKLGERAGRRCADVGPRPGVLRFELERLAQSRADEADVTRRAEDDNAPACREHARCRARQIAQWGLVLDEARDGARITRVKVDRIARRNRRVPIAGSGNPTARAGLGADDVGDQAKKPVAAHCGIGVERDRRVGKVVEQQHRLRAKRGLVDPADAKAIDRLGRQLGDRIEAANRGDPPVVELESRREIGIGGKDVDRRAANRDCAGLVDALVVGVADIAQYRRDRVDRTVVAVRQCRQHTGEGRGRRIQPRRRLGGRDQCDPSRAAFVQRMQRSKAAAGIRRRCRRRVAGQRVARRQVEHRCGGHPGGECGGDNGSALFVRRNVDDIFGRQTVCEARDDEAGERQGGGHRCRGLSTGRAGRR